MIGAAVDPPSQRNNGTSPATETEPPSRDTVFSLLSNSRRRAAIEVLRERDGTASVSDLATAVAAREHGVDAASLERKQRKRVYVALKQVHLPRLEDEGVVHYDPDDNTVVLADDVAELEPFLDADEESDPWPTAYLGVAAAAGLFLAATVAGAVPVPAEAVSAVLVAAVLVTALVHATVVRRQ